MKEELKNTFTSFWEYLTLRTACQLKIFDEIQKGNNTFDKLHKASKTDYTALQTLIFSLIDINAISNKENILVLTEKGELLTENHPETMKNACILWGGEHLTAWQNLDYTIKTGEPAFENIYGMQFFEYLNTDKQILKNYHFAMAEYAEDDYKNIANLIDFSKFDTVADVGGGLGTLIKNIAGKSPRLNCILFELPEVIDLSDTNENVQNISGNFFKKLPFSADAVILSRILHDWDDKKAKQILNNCRTALNENGKLFIAEILNDEIKANMLTLNMRVMCKSFERTYKQYKSLLEDAGFILEKRVKLNDLQTILIAKKNEL
ncbi:MAG: hypothetical protein K8R54_04190 [Bacteroidales bacterium]|nr:hypothetical protein [Bacteroidales bacterium]